MTGTIIGPDGKPRKEELRLRFAGKGVDYSRSSSLSVDEQGRFKLEHLNPDVPGDYSLEVATGTDTRGLVVPLTPKSQPLELHLQV